MEWWQNDTGEVCYTKYNTSYGGNFEYWYVEGFPADLGFLDELREEYGR